MYSKNIILSVPIFFLPSIHVSKLPYKLYMVIVITYKHGNVPNLVDYDENKCFSSFYMGISIFYIKFYRTIRNIL